ncbi:leucine-rich repeat domain-containing protein [Paraglaciecola arctica]|uniref:leucine-rich repeat domain-containing protein n=1 Tax=Paraglaciecola arctica TaxID=1128911 RepID=UPI001C07DD76|nr:leucine-rich repeat domain-containing protein [Paraglaciecola arctica]MBU3005950.1 leucine-rich repeat domain-containing protein [Paraglaciecola arctica]
MERAENKSFMATLTIQIGAVAAYAAGFEPIVDSVANVSDKMGIPKLHVVAIFALPLMWLLLIKLKNLINHWLTNGSFIEGKEYQVDTFRLRPFEYSALDIEKYKNRLRSDGLEVEIAEWIASSNAPVLYLTGKSGSGKSSLLAASVFPSLKQQDTSLQICSIRVYSDPIVDLQQGLEKLSEVSLTPREECCNERIKAILRSLAQRGQVIIAIDQFEELLILHSEKQQEPFWILVNELSQKPIEGIKFLFVCREDYLSELEQVSTFLPRLRSFENWRQVGLFKESMARAFLTSSGLKIGSRLMEKLLKEASDVEETKGQYRPIILNMLGLSLERHIQPAKRLFLGKSSSLLRNLVEAEVGAGEDSWGILASMITDKSTKRALSSIQISRESGLSCNTTNAILRKLELKGIVRQINEDEQVWEISHDFIARILAGSISTRQNALLPKIKPWLAPTFSLALLGAITLPSTENDRILELVTRINQHESTCVLKKNQKYHCNIKLGYDGLGETLLSSVTELDELIPVTSMVVKNIHSSQTIEDIVQLSNLTDFTLFTDEVLSLPESIGQLLNLTTLDLRGSGIMSIPESIGQLKNLTEVRLYSDELQSLPESIGQLTNLTKLDLRYNGEFLPESIGQLTNLTELELYMFKSLSLPESFGQLKNLSTLTLYANEFSSPPENLGQLTNLSYLYLRINKLESLPESFGQLKNLTTLVFSGNKLESLPESFGQLKNLTTLDLSSNKLESLPESFGHLTNLSELNLDHNSLESLPESLNQLNNLTRLDVRNIGLKSIPESFGQLTSLSELNLGYNKLESLPESFGQLKNLTTLDLSDNKLESLPESFGHLTNLSELDLNYNSLESLPESFDQLEKLTTLDLSSNNLKSLPENFGQLVNLRVLDVRFNPLIPLESIIQLNSLTEVYMDENQSKSLPESLNHLKYKFFDFKL